MFYLVSGLFLPEKIPGWVFYSEVGVSCLFKYYAKCLPYSCFSIVLSICALYFSNTFSLFVLLFHHPSFSSSFYVFLSFFPFRLYLFSPFLFPIPKIFLLFLLACISSISLFHSCFLYFLIWYLNFFRKSFLHLLLIQNKVVSLQPQFGV